MRCAPEQDGPLDLHLRATNWLSAWRRATPGSTLEAVDLTTMASRCPTPHISDALCVNSQKTMAIHCAAILWGPRAIRRSCNCPQCPSRRKAHRVFSFFKSLITMYRENVIQPQRNHLIWLSCAVVIAFWAVL
jgi:hypothetical protein